MAAVLPDAGYNVVMLKLPAPAGRICTGAGAGTPVSGAVCGIEAVGLRLGDNMEDDL